MDNWIRASYNSQLRVVDFVDVNGSHLIRSGGTLPWRLNNPGNLRPPVVNGVPRPRRIQGYIGIASSPKPNGELGYFFIFPDYNSGRNAIKGNLKRLYNNKSIRSAIQSYAPSNENNTNQYIDDLQQESGLGPSLIVGELTAAQFEKLVDGIIKIEGYNGNGDLPRREERRSVTNLVVSNGAQPLEGQELVLRQDGVDAKVKTDQTGKIPPIVHNPKKGVIEVLKAKLDGTLEVITKINPLMPGSNLLLIWDLIKFTAPTNKHAGVKSGGKVKKEAVKYVVQPGDSLSKIANKFKISVSDLKKENSIKNINKIFPGEVLIIGGGKEAENQTKPSSPQANEEPKVSKPSPTKQKKEHKENKPKPSTPVPAKTNPLETKSGGTSLPTTVSREGVGSPLASIPNTQIKAPWMEIAVNEAKRWKGQHEKIITKTINYHKEVGVSISTLVGDNQAWCASFVNYCLAKTGYHISSPYPQRARSFIYDHVNFIEVTKPIFGCIASSGHHAAFVYGKTAKGMIVCLGGNQSQTIRLSPFNGMKFFVPVAYKGQYEKDAVEELLVFNFKDVNKEFGINETNDKKKESTR